MPAPYRLREQDFGGGDAGSASGWSRTGSTTGEGSNWGKIRMHRVALCAAMSAGDCMLSWPGRDRRVDQSGGENAVSRWHGDGR